MFRQCQLQWRLRVCLRRYLAVLLIDLDTVCRQEEVAPRDRKSTQRADKMYAHAKSKIARWFPLFACPSSS
jgi:hypothetical protein